MAEFKYKMKRVSVITNECSMFANLLKDRAVLGAILVLISKIPKRSEARFYFDLKCILFMLEVG